MTRVGVVGLGLIGGSLLRGLAGRTVGAAAGSAEGDVHSAGAAAGSAEGGTEPVGSAAGRIEAAGCAGRSPEGALRTAGWASGLCPGGTKPVGCDADPAVADAVARAGFAVARELDDVARACEVVFVCVPPASTAAVVAALLEADPGVVVADTASVKAPVLAAVAQRAGADATRRFVPTHPLAGAAHSGWAGADADLLRDAVWAVCPASRDAPAEPLCAVASALEPLAARLLICDAADHDAAVARSSHAPHLVAQALARMADSGLGAALTGGAYRDMTRTATADEELWLSIVRANRAPAVTALRELGDDLTAFAAALQADDEAVLRSAWRAGATARARVDALRWSQPGWEPVTLRRPVWDALLDLGRAGRTVRRLRLAGDVLELEVARAA